MNVKHLSFYRLSGVPLKILTDSFGEEAAAGSFMKKKDGFQNRSR